MGLQNGGSKIKEKKERLDSDQCGNNCGSNFLQKNFGKSYDRYLETIFFFARKSVFLASRVTVWKQRILDLATVKKLSFLKNALT